MSSPRRFRGEWQVESGGIRVVDFVESRTGLSRGRIKDAMNKGALALYRPGSRGRRLRRATAMLAAGDRLVFGCDETLLAQSPLSVIRLDDRQLVTVWDKPAGMPTQGTEYGDHLSLMRVAGLELGRDVYCVHRLDREASGLIVLAHSRGTAADLSAQFAKAAVIKEYRVTVASLLPDDRGVIDKPLDGRRAVTRYNVIERDTAARRTVLEVAIDTGRTHQIRRHFAGIGYPVVGDRRYGNADAAELALRCVRLGFRGPDGVALDYRRPDCRGAG